MDDQELTRRAIAAYWRYQPAEGMVIDQPASSSGVVTHNGKTYVVLHNANRTLAVYRVRSTGQLKRMKRWPAAVAA